MQNGFIGGFGELGHQVIGSTTMLALFNLLVKVYKLLEKTRLKACGQLVFK